MTPAQEERHADCGRCAVASRRRFFPGGRSRRLRRVCRGRRSHPRWARSRRARRASCCTSPSATSAGPVTPRWCVCSLGSSPSPAVSHRAMSANAGCDKSRVRQAPGVRWLRHRSARDRVPAARRLPRRPTQPRRGTGRGCQDEPHTAAAPRVTRSPADARSHGSFQKGGREAAGAATHSTAARCTTSPWSSRRSTSPAGQSASTGPRGRLPDHAPTVCFCGGSVLDPSADTSSTPVCRRVEITR